eukprot:609964-Prorocentrum_minimum.AAC.2
MYPAGVGGSYNLVDNSVVSSKRGKLTKKWCANSPGNLEVAHSMLLATTPPTDALQSLGGTDPPLAPPIQPSLSRRASRREAVGAEQSQDSGT